MEKISFVDRLVAFIKGDDATVKAGKIQRKAKSQLKIAISNVENDIIKAEESIESLDEELKSAKMNYGSTEFSDDMSYVNRIMDIINDRTQAEENLDNLKKQLTLLKEIIKEVSE